MFKEQFLKSRGWFKINDYWQHPELVKSFDLHTAFLYESFSEENKVDERYTS